MDYSLCDWIPSIRQNPAHAVSEVLYRCQLARRQFRSRNYEAPGLRKVELWVGYIGVRYQSLDLNAFDQFVGIQLNGDLPNSAGCHYPISFPGGCAGGL